jgi:hypothetical protein
MEKNTEETFPAAIKWHQRALCLSGDRHARRDVLRASLVTLKEDPPAEPHKNKSKGTTWQES